MRLRTLKIWHKTKKIWLALAVWAVVSVLILACLAWSFMDYNGGLGRVHSAYQTELKGEEVKRISIAASGVGVEVAGSVDADKVRVYLYGDSYAGQAVRLYQRGDTVYVHLADDPPAAGNFGYSAGDDLTLRVIVPKRNYAEIAVQTQRAALSLSNLRCDLLQVMAPNGSVHLKDLDLKQAEVDSGSAPVEVRDSHINALMLRSTSGAVTVSRSQFKYWQYHNDSGDLLVQQKNIKGVWQLESAAGDITIRTSRTPYDLLSKLTSARGSVAVDYSKYGWDELLEARLEGNALEGCIGEGRQMLFVSTDKGAINVGLD